MKYTVLATLIAIGISGSAFASECSPSISITGNSDLGRDMDIYGDVSRSRGSSIGITLNIPLFTEVCKRNEWETARQTEASRRATELENLENTIRLCEEYGYDHPMLAGRCIKH